MEFNDMKKIWDAQNNEPLYAINEAALHNSILIKKRKAYHITNISELLGIIVYGVAGAAVFGINFYKADGGVFMYLLAGWLIASALWALISRIRRIKGEQQYGRSLRGNLAHAIAMATYQVRLSRLMRWNILPIGVFVLLIIWDSGKPLWIVGCFALFFILTHFASGWEHSIYKNKKRELQILKNKLDNEE